MIENQLIMKSYPIQFFKNKYIIYLGDNTFQINFKEEKTNIFFEILIILKSKKEANKNKSKLIEEFENEDINVWLQKTNFKITSDLEKDIIIYDCKITISNKTLKFKKELTNQKHSNILNLQNSFMNNNNDKISNENNKGEKGIYRNISLNLDNERIIPNNTNDISSNNLKGNEIIQLEDELKKKLNDEKIKNKKLDKENKDLKESLNKINQNHLNEMNKIKSELDKYKKKKEKLKSELDKYKNENEKLKQDLIKVNKIISGIDNYQIDANEIKNLKDENNKLKNELSLKENEIKDLKNIFKIVQKSIKKSITRILLLLLLFQWILQFNLV